MILTNPPQPYITRTEGESIMSKLDISDKIKLVIARLDILKLQASNGGYDWGMTPDNVRKEISDTLTEIENLLNHQEKDND